MNIQPESQFDPGISPWNFVEYWNRVHFQDGTFSGLQPLSEMWMPPVLLEDSSLYEAFLELILRRAPVSQHQSHLHAKATGFTVDAIRFYARQGLLPHPPRSKGGWVSA